VLHLASTLRHATREEPLQFAQRDDAVAVAIRPAALAVERADLARLERLLGEAKLTADELKALARLDEANQLAIGANRTQAVGDVARLWTLAEHRRDTVKSAEAHRRIHSLVHEEKPAGPTAGGR
jgi:hypothetical protein